MLSFVGKILSKCPLRSSSYYDSNKTIQSSGVRMSIQLSQLRFYKLLIFLEKNRLSCLIAHKRSFFFSLKDYLSFLVKCYSPNKFNVSVNKICLIFLSMGEDELRDGHTLTSIIHGFKLLSMRISNPYNSNPQFLLYCVFECISNITGYAEIHVFINMPLISSNNYDIKNKLLSKRQSLPISKIFLMQYVTILILSHLFIIWCF